MGAWGERFGDAFVQLLGFWGWIWWCKKNLGELTRSMVYLRVFGYEMHGVTQLQAFKWVVELVCIAWSEVWYIRSNEHSWVLWQRRAGQFVGRFLKQSMSSFNIERSKNRKNGSKLTNKTIQNKEIDHDSRPKWTHPNSKQNGSANQQTHMS